MIGECEDCRFIGVLVRKQRLRPQDVDTLDPDRDPTDVPVLRLCGTCADTPNGARSANASHRRLIPIQALEREDPANPKA